MYTPVRKTDDNHQDGSGYLQASRSNDISYRDAGSRGYAKPDGAHGAEFKTAVIDINEPIPTDWAEFTESTFDISTPVTFTFSGKQRGMRFVYSSRWENTRGEKGPWGDIL
jgi:hypothetical protein